MVLSPTKRLIDHLIVAMVSTGPFSDDFQQIALVKAPFTPSPDLVLADVVLADFADSTPWETNDAGNFQQFINNTTENYEILAGSSGRPVWTANSGSNLPQTIFGGVMIDETTTEVTASFLFPVPRTLTKPGQGIFISLLLFTVTPTIIG